MTVEWKKTPHEKRTLAQWDAAIEDACRMYQVAAANPTLLNPQGWMDEIQLREKLREKFYPIADNQREPIREAYWNG